MIDLVILAEIPILIYKKKHIYIQHNLNDIEKKENEHTTQEKHDNTNNNQTNIKILKGGRSFSQWSAYLPCLTQQKALATSRAGEVSFHLTAMVKSHSLLPFQPLISVFLQ